MRLSALLRQAGIFTYPPVMFAEIAKWVDATIAGHYLAQAIEVQKKWPAQSLPKKASECKEWVDSFVQEIIVNIHDIKGREHNKGPNVMKYNVTAPVRAPTDPDEKDVVSGYVGCMELDIYDNRDEKGERKFGLAFIPGKMDRSVTPTDFDKHCERVNGLQGLPPEQAEKAAHTIGAKAKAAIEAWAQKHRMKPTSSEVRTIDWKMLETECRKYTSKAKFYKSKTTEDFKVNLAGWPYLPGTLHGETIKRSQALADHNKQVIEKLLSAAKNLRVEAGKESLTKKFTLRGLDFDQIVWVKAEPAHYYAIDKSISYSVCYEGRAHCIGSGAKLEFLQEELEKRHVEMILSHAKRESEGYKDIDDYLKKNRLDTTHVVLHFSGHKGRAGLWNFNTKTLEIDVSNFPVTVDGFHDSLKSAHETIRHELQHLGQDYLARLKGLREEAGLPSKALREKGMTPYGTPLPMKGKSMPKRPKQIEHESRDVEFYTDLGDNADRFLRWIKGVGKAQLRDMFDSFVGTFGPATNKYFQTWKTKNKAKWQKAVTEFEKALANQGVTIPGRDKWPNPSVVRFQKELEEKQKGRKKRPAPH